MILRSEKIVFITSSTRTRRGGSCLKDIYKTFLIYRTCMRRAPAKPVRACILRKWGPVSHVTFEAPLRTSHFSLHSSHSTLHASHSTLHTSHCTLRTPHFTLHTSQSTLHTSHFTLHTSHSTLHTPHFTLHSSRPTLLTPHCFLHTHNFTLHTSHCTLHAPHFTLHSSHSTLHLIWALLTLSQLISSHLFSSLLICHLSFHESLPSTTTNHCRSLDAPTPIRFTIFSCKIQEYYVCSRGTKQPWRSHSNAICRDSVAKHNRITRNGIGNCSSKTGWISTPKRKKDDFEALFKRILKRKITSAKMEKICWQSHFAAWMQPLQYDLRSSAAKDNSITHAAAAPSNLDAATTMRSAETELQNTIELRAMASEIATPKPDGSRRQSDKKTILNHFLKGILKGKLLAPKWKKTADNSLSQPWCKHSNTIYDLQLQKTIVLRMQPLHQAIPMRFTIFSCKRQ